MSSLATKIASRSSGIRLYGITPPKRSIADDALRAVVAAQTERIMALGADGLVVYDIEDESARTDAPRPFPFLPTIDAATYAHATLTGVTLPKIVYRPVARFDRASFEATLRAERDETTDRFTVLVGAPSRNAAPEGLRLGEAYELARELAPRLSVGAIAIAERHARGFTEHERMVEKLDRGCRYFITQAVYDVVSTKSLLSDLALRLAIEERAAPPVLVTLSPCGSPKTLDFMRWLGIAFPRWLENDLRSAPDILDASVEHALRIFDELADYAHAKGIPLGVNVESVSVRKAEIDASVALFEALSRRIDRR